MVYGSLVCILLVCAFYISVQKYGTYTAIPIYYYHVLAGKAFSFDVTYNNILHYMLFLYCYK